MLLDTHPVVRVLGGAPVDRLARSLPASWEVRSRPNLDRLADGELVLLLRPPVRMIDAVRRQLPVRGCLVVVIDVDAPAEMVAAVLQAGADVCVRDGSPAILAGHLLAAHRRLRHLLR
jgi:hypothetical protein